VLNPGDVGHRVVVRYRTADGPSDVLGELIRLDTDLLAVRTEAGEEREIPQRDVVAGKPVGPRPPRYSEIIALERVAERAWPAPEVEQVGGWLLRAAGGWTNRANSALPLGPGAGPLEETVRACRRFYTARGLTPKITVPLPVGREVARHLEATGWVAQPAVLVQTAPLPGMAAPAPGVDLRPEPSPEFLALVAARKEGLPRAATHVLTAVPAVRFGQVVGGREPGWGGVMAPDGTLLAATRGAVVESWLHIGLVEVVPGARRQGHARALASALAAWAVELGAARGVLQVEQRNEPAIRLYEGLGFVTHHTYVTYRAP